MSDLICDGRYYGFLAHDCPDYGSSDCPRTIPGAKCLMDEEYAKQILESKRIYFEKKAAKERGWQ